jgi:hypothetical protein
MKTLVLYATHVYNRRVQMFIDNAIFNDENVDFLIVINNKELVLPVPDYVKVINRENRGTDFGAWSEGIFYNDNFKKYDRFIFVNSSIVGPYLPADFKGKWTDLFLSGLTENIKLFGSTINTMCNPLYASHVQSYAFCLDQDTLQFLIEKKIFTLNTFATDYQDAIHNYEIRMSRAIIEAGWNIGSLMQYYKGVDFTFINMKISDFKKNWLDDITLPYGIEHGIIRPEEVVFIKGKYFGIE